MAPTSNRILVALITLLLGTGLAAAQDLPVLSPGKQLKTIRPRTPREHNRSEAQKRYGMALLSQRQDRLVEATRLLEEATTLDAESATLQRALIPLYLAMARMDDALATCDRTLELDPDDYATGYLRAQQLQLRARSQEARTALAKALRSKRLGERPDLRVQMQYDLGSWHEEAGQLDDAIKTFAEVVAVLDKPAALLEAGSFNVEQLAEQAANTHERLVRVCLQAKQYDRALEFFEMASKKHVILRGRLNFSLAQICLGKNRPQDALHHLEEYLRTQPQGTEAYELKIRVLKQLGREADITAFLEDAAQRDAQNVTVKLLLAREYARAGRSNRAEEVYSSVIEVTPSADAYRGLFALYRDTLRGNQAFALLDEALAKSAKKDPQPGEVAPPAPNPAQFEEAAAKARAMLAVLREDVDLVKMLFPAAEARLRSRNELQRETRYFLAVMAGRTHQLAHAERFYRSCFRNDGRLEPQTEVAVYHGLLLVLWEGRKYGDVVRLCEQGLQVAQATNRWMFHYNLSRAFVLLGRANEALSQADQTIALASEDSRLFSRLNRVRILRYTERFEQSLAECQALLKEYAKPEDVRDIRYDLSGIYTQARDQKKAEEQLELILEADPNDATANNDLGYLWADQGKNLIESERLIRKAIDLDRQQKKRATGNGVGVDDDRENAAYLDSLGWVLFKRGQIEAALEWLKKAAELPLGAEDPVVWDHLGDTYYRLENLDKARAAWRKSVELYEAERRRKPDERYREVLRKLELPGTGSARR